MRVALVSLYACGNAGDEALLRCVVQQLRDTGIADELVSVGIGPCGTVVREIPPEWDPMGPAGPIEDVFTGFEGNRDLDISRLLVRGDLWRATNAARGCDLLLWAGGYWLHDRRPGTPLSIAWLCQAAPAYGFYAVGAGPLDTVFGSTIIRGVAARAVHVSVRDAGSREVLANAGVDREIMVTADPAVRLEACESETVQRLLTDAGLDPARPMVAISPCAWYSMEQYYKREDWTSRSVVDVLSGLARQIVSDMDHQILLLPTMWPEDAAIADEIIGAVAHENVGSISRQPSGPEAQGLIEHCDALVSMRLHPAIFAMNTRTPMVAVAYDRKVQAFMNQINASNLTVPLQHFGVETLFDCLEMALEKQMDLARQFEAAHRMQVARAEETAERLVKDMSARSERGAL